MSEKSKDKKVHTNEKPITLTGLEFEQVLAALMQTEPGQPVKEKKGRKAKGKLLKTATKRRGFANYISPKL